MEAEGLTYPTLRDWFAMAAMAGDMARSDGTYANRPEDAAAKRYYKIADAMLKAREAE
jgi:hypothetical protein